MRRRRAFTESEKTEIWNRIEAGQTPASVAALLGRYPSAIRALQQASGGVRHEPKRRRAGLLSLGEREEISRGLSAGHPLRAIAGALGRAPSRVCREVSRNDGATRYRACVAERAPTSRSTSRCAN
jgi:IS30 family transposase